MNNKYVCTIMAKTIETIQKYCQKNKDTKSIIFCSIMSKSDKKLVFPEGLSTKLLCASRLTIVAKMNT